MDKYFRVQVLSATPNPQQVIYAAMHQDYSEEFVYDELEWWGNCIVDPTSTYKNALIGEKTCGDRIVNNLLKGGRGHFGPLEHPQIIFNAGWFPHSVMQQLRTHRVGVSFDVQSGRYTGQRIIDVANGKRDVEEVFYFRPVGSYTDRQGKKYRYGEIDRKSDIEFAKDACFRYQVKIEQRGFSEEHARGGSLFDIRQHFVVSFNVRSFLHLCDLRGKKDAQLECQQFVELTWPHFKEWCPQIADWYEETRMGKARLAP